ncbi:MAG: NADP-dependent oxidoreductase [Ilumatobacter sp.]|uniref:NADP-dependent oxidoreductase n=1 Tax=Ilumatobacter sp. TaxID=1967498 RepID=UPI0032978971
MTDTRTSRQINLVARPNGAPVESDFEVVEVDVAAPSDGEVVVANRFMSVDPYMRGRMNDVKSYVAPFQLGEVLAGGAVGEVIESNSPDVAVGDLVTHGLGWREIAVVPADETQPATAVEGVPLSANLGVLGMPGLTAYAGLLEVASFVEGDAVFVSGAAGAVGSVVGQIAKLKGASRVIGSAGSDEKVSFLTDLLGFDAAFNYKSGPVSKQLLAAAPDGIDVYFDNVGGDHLQAALHALKPNGRVAMCGAISVYNNTEPAPGPNNLTLAIGKQLTLKGFLVGAHASLREQFVTEVGGWLADGSLRNDETIVEGIDNAPSAFIGLLAGANTGKMVVAI